MASCGQFTATVVCDPALAITTSCPLTPGSATVAYGPVTLAETGGTGPFTWDVSAGTLPTGLTLHSATGVIDGTPSTLQNSSFTLRVTDTFGCTATKSCSLVIGCPPITITSSCPLVDAIRGVAYGPVLLTESGGTGPFTWDLAAGALPAGLTLHADGTIDGTPT